MNTSPYERITVPVPDSPSWLARILTSTILLHLTGALIGALHLGPGRAFILLELVTLPLLFVVCWLARLAWRRRA